VNGEGDGTAIAAVGHRIHLAKMTESRVVGLVAIRPDNAARWSDDGRTDGSEGEPDGRTGRDRQSSRSSGGA